MAVKIYVVMATLNEADIIAKNVDHLLGQGVDRILICDGGSTDGTRDILHWWPGRVETITDPRRPFKQVQIMCDLIAYAGDHYGADWILPIDADEFWFADDSNYTIRQALEAAQLYRKLYVPVWHHTDWDHRWVQPKMQKVAFRYQPGVTVTMGHHDCSIPGGKWGILQARELQYQSFAHFLAKIRQQIETLDPALPAGDAAHVKQYRGMSRDEMLHEWEEMQAKPTVYDPIPYVPSAVWTSQ